ncbi:universal stress protein [Aquincola sp. S2]|uniref:Universal stress protein n=1 Tax=Pseudaquabacterium terrae TaxID=2732868 RepID=A0ABX2ER38_9BURK|nr:universal stress protein [Aquabacterium terrae]NRF70976.1 universal stress protein [Aquabacterium terrae]
MYSNLLVPIDGGALSDKAIAGSIALAQQLGAAITGFVAEPSLPLPAVGRPAHLVERELALHDDRTASHAHDLLGRFERCARDAGVRFSGHHVQSAFVDTAILDAAREHGCDLIVMTTHRRGLLGELLHGACTKAVLARSPVPLLVLH